MHTLRTAIDQALRTRQLYTTDYAFNYPPYSRSDEIERAARIMLFQRDLDPDPDLLEVMVKDMAGIAKGHPPILRDVRNDNPRDSQIWFRPGALPPHPRDCSQKAPFEKRQISTYRWYGKPPSPGAIARRADFFKITVLRIAEVAEALGATKRKRNVG